MMDSEYTNPLYEASIKLCAAVKKYKCLHDKNSYHKYATPECEAAWKLVALECKETVDYCKNRWKSLRRCFFKGLKRRRNKYYLHEYLEFLQDQSKKKTKRNPNATLNDETNSAITDTLQNHTDKSLKLDDSGMETINVYDDDDDYDDDMKSVSSHTTSADESHEMAQGSDQMGVFIIDEFEENPDERRLSYKRSCKRPLAPELINELAEDELEEKRTRKTGTEKFKTFTNENDQSSLTPPLAIKQFKPKMDKLRVNLVQRKVKSIEGNMVDRFTCTDMKQTRDFATQYELNSQDFDEIFMQSINSQLQIMNARQKMNFKRKIYQSLLEVFDDGTNFPKFNETLQLPNKQAPRIINSTIGELRLMRELVSLVQAAKNTPEIMNATEKVKTSEPVQSKLPLNKPPIQSAENRSRDQTSPLSLSSSLDDDDLQLSINNNDDDVVPLPRTWEQIKVNTTEPPKAKSEDVIKGLPRRLLQKVVKVSGSGTSTIVTRDGDKKRIYRIYPKLINPNPNDNRILPTTNGSNVGTFFVSTTKNPQDTTGNPNINNNNVSIVNKRVFNNKPTNNTNGAMNSVNKSNQAINQNTSNNTTDDETIFNTVHPANRILCASTGSFKTITPAYIYKSSSSPAAGTTTPLAPTKVITTKLPAGTMLPPTSNITAKRSDMVRAGPQLMQRRYSICGAMPANSAATPSNKADATNNNNSKGSSSISKIKISQAVSLNTKSVNDQVLSSNKNISSNDNTKSAAPGENIKKPIISVKAFKESISTIDPVTSITKAGISTTTKNEIPILETAGTVEADILDPLFVKPPEVKMEPVDD